MESLPRIANVVEISLSNFCNFSCDYCISGSKKRKIPLNPDGSARVFDDLRYNHNGMVDHSRIRKYGLSVRWEYGDLRNYGKINVDGTVDRGGDFIIRNDFIDYSKLLNFLRNRLPNWVIHLTGGEPLHNPQIEDFLIDLTTTHKVILLTNSSLIRAKKRILEIPREMLFYRIGFHPEQYNPELYYEMISYIRDAGKDYRVNYVLHPRHYIDGLAKAYVDFLKDNNFNYEVTRFEGEYGGIKYPTAELHPVELELVSPVWKENNYTTDTNTPGKTYLFIAPDGAIYQCPKKTMRLGSIYDKFIPTNRVEAKSCFSGGNKCQSVIMQEDILRNWIS